ncbi:MAG: flagellar hook-associated protein FlgK [Sphaerospermopsis sp. SIO1G2]|nr:flagellar hook-associated protein FlgK [Sphaerospermopsis sp. SIO1G2]
MSLQLALNNALTGLNVNQTALSVVSQNIANVNTEGYSRKTVDQSAIYVGKQGIGTGVRVDDIVRKVDAYLQRTTRTQTSQTLATNTVSEYMDRIQVLLGQPGDVNTLDEYLTSFFNDLQSLAETPDRISFREAAVDSGIVLAREIAELAASFEDLRFQADTNINESVGALNNFLADLEQINVAVLNADALGNPISGLQDEQDILIQNIAEIIDIDVLRQESNEVYIYAANGIALLDEASYELEYNEISNIEQLIDDITLSPINVYRLDDDGERILPAEELVSGGVGAAITTSITEGSLRAELDMRDTIIPEFLSQLDEMAATLRDAFNAIHNDGSGFPGANSYTGTRAVNALDHHDWEGSVRMTVLNENGEPIPSPFAHESDTGIRPLTMDLTFLDDDTVAGQPDIQTIIDEINNHFNPPTTKVALGNLNNIQLVSLSDQLPNANSNVEFDFDLENISSLDADFFVSNVEVIDNLGVNITNTSSTRPSLAPVQYQTNQGSRNVTIITGNHSLADGDFIYMEQPAGPLGTIPTTEFPNYFQVSNVTNTSFDIATNITETNPGTTVTAAGTELIYSTYDTIAAGDKRRVRDSGTITADLTGNPNSPYYDIQVSVGVFPSDATTVADLRNATITFRIFNNSDNLRNDRFDHTALNGAHGERFVPDDITPYMQALLVDADGNEIPKVNGDYIDAQGYLQLVAQNENYTIAIDELDSRETGITRTSPVSEGTNRGFSHFFELNNFFQSNESIVTGDTTDGTAINFQVEQRLIDNANLITLGNLERSTQPADSAADPLYTYERRQGANGAIQRLADMNNTLLDFSAAGGLDSSRQTVLGYMGEVLSYYGARAASAEIAAKDNQILLDGFTQRIDSFKGVNVDEELANTIIYQSAYNASARIISVTSEMFDALFDSVR